MKNNHKKKYDKKRKVEDQLLLQSFKREIKESEALKLLKEIFSIEEEKTTIQV